MNAIKRPAEGGMIYCKDCQPKGLYVYHGASFFPAAYDISEYNPVVGSGGAIWLDRNLGASQLATSSTDANAYGDLYQWGRNSDGHQIRTSATSFGPVASGSEGSNFIVTSISVDDWLTAGDTTRWNGSEKGLHDPCPTGFRVPTRAEWDTEVKAWPSFNSAGAFASPLRLTLAGFRDHGSGNVYAHDYNGYYCSSTTSGNRAYYLDVGQNSLAIHLLLRKSKGCSVRCIKG